MNIILNNNKYKIIKNYRDAYDEEALTNLFTDYFYDYDYVVGDWAYGKLRLKGFYKDDNKKVKQLNNIKYVDEYIKNNCAYDCKYFIIEKE